MHTHVTIAIPYYSNPEYLRAAIESVFAQSDPHWRLVVVDDGADGSGRNVVHTYTDERVKYLRNPRTLGMAGNWNRCLDSAETDLVTLFHADDVLKADYVRDLRVVAGQHPKAAASFCVAEPVGADGQRLFSVGDFVKEQLRPRGNGVIQLEGRPGIEALARGNFLYCPTACYRRSILGQRRFSARWRFVLDLEFFTQLLFSGDALLLLPQVLYGYRRHSASSTSQFTNDAQKFREEALFFDELAESATVRGWHRAARRARHRWIHKLNLLYCLFADLRHGWLTAAGTKTRMLLSNFIHQPPEQKAVMRPSLSNPASEEESGTRSA